MERRIINYAINSAEYLERIKAGMKSLDMPLFLVTRILTGYSRASEEMVFEYLKNQKEYQDIIIDSIKFNDAWCNECDIDIQFSYRREVWYNQDLHCDDITERQYMDSRMRATPSIPTGYKYKYHVRTSLHLRLTSEEVHRALNMEY